LAAAGAGNPRHGELSALLDAWPDGRIKLLVTATGLRFRRAHPDLVRRGQYAPLAAEGPAADHLVAFARHDPSGVLLVIAPRLVAPLMAGGHPPLGDAAWSSTTISLPAGLATRPFRHLVTGELVPASTETDADRVAVAAILRTIPVGLLWAPAASTSA